MAFPSASPPIKLERINAAAQTELPNARPLSRSQRVSKISAATPDRKRMAEKIAIDALGRTFRDCAPYDTCDVWVVWELLIIAKSGGDRQIKSALRARTRPH
jgi:hypothetical protein